MKTEPHQGTSLKFQGNGAESLKGSREKHEESVMAFDFSSAILEAKR